MGGWFHFSRSDRRAMPWLVLLLVAVGGGLMWLAWRPQPPAAPPTAAERNGLDSFVRRMQQPAPAARPRAATTVHLERFNPNTADSATFVRLGLKPWQARAIDHYRQAGGRFRVKDDFARLYGLRRADFLRLRPYIDLPERLPAAPARTEPTQPRPAWPRKLQPGQTIDLATADTALLQRIPGIGPYWARRIVDYGRRLGGYVSLRQLGEIRGLPPEAHSYLTLNHAPAPRRLAINRATFKQLLAHPYLDYPQVCAIMNRRRRFGPLHALTQLLTDTAFTRTDVARLAPYVDLEP